MNLVRIQKLSISIPENLAEILEEEIIYGRLKSRERLTEEMIAERYGVSRSPVREALRLLERDGLVIREARRGIWVAPLSLKDFDEVYTCRIELEGLAAKYAALSNDTERKGEFSGLQNELTDAIKRNDAKQFFLVDVRGSLLTYTLADNKTLTRLLGGLEKQALRYRFHAYQQNPNILQLSFDDTARIYDAIRDGDAAKAQDLTENLIREIWQKMREGIRGSFGAE
ncbi:GntR family transcriptional regulator [Phyllobacterium chamaecytisi]|uniref:GntR family transcriptional regulator n=1 Tax=Phyllobacterium chamaecytisi TaxID=2876082 RepID=UPI001CCECFD7|nr:GntR family transcriptional regulator [Phyllobacterium sp. KW56]MBZ9603608.1 GntR family transcriptional regulator [Phyllobacterium sp. KW56]